MNPTNFGRKALFLAVVAVIVVTGAEHKALACDYTFDPEKIEGVTGTEVTVVAHLKWTHRKCELHALDIKFEANGAEVLSFTPWTETSKSHFSSTIKLRLGAPGNGSLRVFRTCSKEGTTEGTAPIKIKPAS
jgi:hypothetical protein